MAMDVSSLELTLSQYNAQLTQIQNLISTADALTKLELYDLEKDLMEMIKLTEGQLLSAKKEKLLAKVSGGCSNEDSFDDHSLTSKPIEDNVDKEQSLNISDSAAVNNASIDSFCDMQLDLVGVKCRVKFTQDWGSFQYHNAMILSCDIDDALQDEQIKVCVLFLNPIHISMVPCKYILDGTCNYEDDCRYSHGYHVDLDEVKEYKEPDFSQVRNGSKCIAKFEENGVWYPAVVDELFEDQVTISFDTYNETLTVNYDSILPMQSSDDNDSSSSEEDETIDVDEQIDISYKPVSMSGHFGEWEEYTKGIGSKLMAKMGYIFGKGLGKDGEGRLDPVEIKLLPPGKSLDYIAEMREKGLIKDPIKKKKKSKQSLSEQKQIPESAFQIINRLTHRESSAVADREYSGQSFTIEDSYKSLKMHMKNRKNTNSKTGSKQKDSKLNIEMFKVSEKITSLKKKLALQNESLARNTGDTKLAVIIKQNIDATEKELSELQRVDRSLQEKLHMKNQSKKLSVF